MDSTPTSGHHRSRTKLLSRLSKLRNLDVTAVELSPSFDLANSPSPTKAELLLLSPSPYKRSKTRLADRLEMADEAAKRCKSRSGASPRISRRSRRRSEMEVREEKDSAFVEEVARPRRRRNSGRSRKETLTLVPVVTTSSSFSKCDEGDYDRNLELIGEAFSDLVMWRDTARSSLWFGFGCLCCLSSCFSWGLNISVFVAICQLGLLFLGFSFFSNSICSNSNAYTSRNLKLTEEDVLRVSRLVLPATNLAIAKSRELFSGEPSMTLKVAPLLLLGAEYGHLLTMRRFCVIGFFISFSAPKLYSNYSNLIHQRAESSRHWICRTWTSCSHKKVVAVACSMAFWNLTTIRTRILTTFISVVILRYFRQQAQLKLDQGCAEEMEDENDEQAIAVVEERNRNDS